MELFICENVAVASQKAADMISELVKENPQAILGLATGSTPEKMYQILIEDHKKNGTSYADVKTVNLDEYVGLAGTHEQSYRYFMDKHLFDKLDIKKENTYVPLGLGNPEENAKKYDEILARLGTVDIQVLGIGSNGHIAFNEPGISFDHTTHVVDLVPETIAANARFFNSLDEVPKTAVSMGIASILKAKEIILLAFGKGKAEAIRAMFEDEISTACPATALQNHPNVYVFVDEAAAALLSSTEVE
jgi:glucosamine-6-phosphate isomerase